MSGVTGSYSKVSIIYGSDYTPGSNTDTDMAGTGWGGGGGGGAVGRVVIRAYRTTPVGFIDAYGVDLVLRFKAKVSSSSAPATGLLTPNGVDLNQVFEPRVSAPRPDVNFKGPGGIDLSQWFEKEP